MRVLWITNTIFPAPSKALGLPEPVTGGWMYGLAGRLASAKGICMAVATTYRGNEFKTFNIDGAFYYLLPLPATSGYPKRLETWWRKVCADFKPDLIHIHGTEYAHGLTCMRACPAMNFVVSIQGLTSVYAEHFYAGISRWQIARNITLRDILRRDTIFQGKQRFIRQGVLEKEYLRRARAIIGRTQWDYAHTRAINPSVNYYFCNEILRNGFYTSAKWNSAIKTDHTIFLTQANYPIKGLHQVLKAVALLKKDFPHIKIKVAGRNIINTATFIDTLKTSGYGAYILKLTKQLHLRDHIQFVGPLAEEEMIKEYLNAHVFVCPSSIENSPNSVGEAQLLGVPVIASHVGGVPDMIVHGETGLLYGFEEVEILSEQIRHVFTDQTLAEHLSQNGIEAAEKRHHPSENLNQMLASYRLIAKKIP